MTYYEWVEYIESLKNKNINDEVIKKINTYDFDYSEDTLFRLLDHIIGVIYKKLIEQKENLKNNLENIKSPQELSLLIDKIKLVFKDVNKLLDIKYFDNSFKNDLKADITEFSEEYIDIIRTHYNNGRVTNDYGIVLNNLKFMEEK